MDDVITVLTAEEVEQILTPRIRTVVENASGGIKFTELCVNIAEDILLGNNLTPEARRWFIQHYNNLPYLIEQIVRQSTELKILEYQYLSAHKLKMFVYTP